MNDFDIEPGLLPVFRLFMLVQIGLILALMLTMNPHGDAAARPVAALLSMLIPSAILLGYVSWRRLQQQLDGWYLPPALFVLSLLPVTGQYLAYGDPAYRGAPGFASIHWLDFAFQQMLLIFPLLLISWQYGFNWSVFFSLSTGLADCVLASVIFSYAELEGSQYFPVLFIRVLTFIAIGYIVAHLMKAQRLQRQSLREANLNLVNYAATREQLATSQERNRLARELHDTLAHTLSGIAVQLEAADSLWVSRPGQARLLYQQSLALTRNGLTETRRALQTLRANPLEDMGLSLALRNLVETVAARGGLSVDLHLDENCRDLPIGVEQAIYRVAQEALENIARHAQAHRIKLELIRKGGTLLLTIADDGRGFDLKAVKPEGHFGLKGLYERADLIGAQFEIVSRLGEGTSIRLQVKT